MMCCTHGLTNVKHRTLEIRGLPKKPIVGCPSFPEDQMPSKWIWKHFTFNLFYMPFIVKKLLVVHSFFEFPEDLIAIHTKKCRDLELLVIDDMTGRSWKGI